MLLKGFAILPVFALFLIMPAQACSCLGADSAAEQAESADIVFIGRVLHSGPQADTRPLWRRWLDWRGREAPAHGRHVTTFQVDEVLKGRIRGDIAIGHLPGIRAGECGVDFAGRHARLVLAWDDPGGGYSTSICSLPRFPEPEFRAALAD